MKNSKSQRLTRASLSCAIYIALSAIFAPISFGPVQVRVSEALTVLPLFFPECSIGLTIGCVVSNFIFSTPLDAGIGGLATLLSSLFTAIVGIKIRSNVKKIVLGELPVILFNAFLVPFVFTAFSDGAVAYWYGFATVGLGELVSVGVLGTVLYFAMKKIMKKSGE